MKFLKLAFVLTMFAVGLGCGYSSKATTPPTAGAVPAIAQLQPDNATHGGAGFNMVVNGSNFGSKAVVNWNGAQQTTTFVSANQLSVAIPASLITTAGSAQVTVTNPGTPGGAYGGGTMAETSTPPTMFTIN